MTPTAFRELRHYLFVRLALGGGLLIVVGAFALTWVPGAATMGPPPTAPGVGTGTLPNTVAVRDPAQAAVGSIFTAAPRDLLEKPRLEELMRPLAAPESLDGKAFEVMPRTGEPEGSASAPNVPEDKVEAPAKLPKGPHLQAGIFAQPANAEEFRRKLVAEGYPAYIETRVHVGPYPNRKEAERVRDKLKAEGTTTVYVPQ